MFSNLIAILRPYNSLLAAEIEKKKKIQLLDRCVYILGMRTATVLTMTGMVDALHRICLTRRYRSYRGFMSCLSVFVILKEERGVSVEPVCVIGLKTERERESLSSVQMSSA